MATVTVTTAAEAVAVWEQEQVAACLRCCYPTTTAPVAKGVVVAGGILCDDCRFHLIHIGEWGDFLARLCPTRPEGADDGDDDPDGGPAAPAPAARPTLWLIVSGQSVARELTPEEEAELAEFVEACAETAPLPQPCCKCNRPASPYQDTPDGPLCFRCWGPGPSGPGTPDQHRPDRADLASVWLEVLTELQAARERSAQVDAVLQRIR
jgi:hypothetical protein